MSVFVNYGGPKLDKKQKQIVRSQAMVSVRDQQKQARTRHLADVAVQNLAPRLLASAEDRDSPTNVPIEDDDHAQHPMVAMTTTLPNETVPQSSRTRTNVMVGRSGVVARKPNIYDLRGAPPQSTHMTGVDARTFQDYLSRCGSYSSYLDEAFILVGFRLPSYFRPDLSKAACIYIGWLLTAGVLDAFRGTVEISYPYYEYQAVKELQKFIDGAQTRELYEVVYPVLILGMFEMVRFSPRAVTHLAAVERFIRSRGGLRKMPDVMQHLVIMADMLECVCLNTPLAFNTLNSFPTIRLQTSVGFLTGDQLLSSPLLLCNNEDFSLVTQYVIDPALSTRLESILFAASDIFQRLLDGNMRDLLEETDLDSRIDAIAESPIAANDVPGLFLETCALATRITRRTLSRGLNGFDDPANESDVLEIYDNARFIGLKAWTGLPYIYVWVNLIGFVASVDERMRSYFVAEVVRCAFSYGCYQMEVFRAVLNNFLHLRNAVASRKGVLAVLRGA